MESKYKTYWLTEYDFEDRSWTDNEPEFPEDTIRVVEHQAVIDLQAKMDALISPEFIRKLVCEIKRLENQRTPPFQLPPDSFIEGAVRKVIDEVTKNE